MDKELQGIIHRLSFHPDKRLEIFASLPPAQRAESIMHIARHIQRDLVRHLKDKELIETLEFLDPDQATDIIQLLPHHKQNYIVEKLKEELKHDVEILTQFDPQTAAGLMNVDYIQVTEEDTIAEVAKRFKRHEKRTGRLPSIIVEKNGKAVGYLPGHELGFAHPGEAVRKYVRRISTIEHNASHDEVVDVFKEHPHNKVVVIGDKGNILGVIYSDDVLRVLEEQESSSLYDFAGVHDEESVTDSAKNKIKFRYKWLIINLATAFLAAFTVGLFEDTISKYVLLAVYMPIVAGMGGNAATQTLAVMVRGLALKQIEFHNAWPVLRRELGAGFVNGLINGLLVAAVVIFLNGDIAIAVILALAMIVNLLVAGFFGTVVPLIMKWLGKDPATSATIFITTATDVLGFLAFLGLATILLT